MLAFILLFFQIVSSSQAQLNFDKANQLLQEQDYTAALKAYQELRSTGWVSGPLALNTGLAYAQLDSLGKAKAYFLQASEFEQTREEAQKGLDFVGKKLPQKAAHLPKLPWDYILDATITLGTQAWSWLAMISAYASLLLLALYWFLFRENNWMLRSFWAVLVLTGFLAAAAFYTDYVHFRYGKAVLITQQSDLKKSPDSEAEVVSLTFEGYEFTVDFVTSQENADWIYVRMSNGIYGWIKKSDLLLF
jgi:hypothetical protein